MMLLLCCQSRRWRKLLELTLSEKIKRLFYQSWRITADYFKSRALVSLIIAVTAGLCFRLLKMPVWWLLALIAGGVGGFGGRV